MKFISAFLTVCTAIDTGCITTVCRAPLDRKWKDNVERAGSSTRDEYLNSDVCANDQLESNKCVADCLRNASRSEQQKVIQIYKNNRFCEDVKKKCVALECYGDNGYYPALVPKEEEPEEHEHELKHENESPKAKIPMFLLTLLV